MALKFLSKRAVRGAAVLVAGGALTAGVLAVVQPAQAGPASLTLTYTCTWPLIGSTPGLSVDIHVTLPDNPVAGTPSGAIPFTADVTVPAAASGGLNTVSGAYIVGSAKTQANISGPTNLPLNLTANVPETAVPQDGSAFTVHAGGQTPSVAFPTAGTETITIGNIINTLIVEDANHQPIGGLTGSNYPAGSGKFDAPCTQDPGQNNTLGTITVVPQGPPPPPTTSTTSVPPPPPTSTTTTSAPPPPPTSTTSVPPPPPTSTTSVPPPPPTSTTSVPPPPPTSTTSVPPPPPTSSTGGGGGGIPINFKVDGSSHLAGLNADIPVHGTLGIELQGTGDFTGDLNLTDQTVSFNLLGFLPGTSKVSLLPVGKTTGTFADGVVHSDSKETVRLDDVTLFGIPLVSNSTTCQTTSPSDIQLVSDPGFTPYSGGVLKGSYNIGPLAGCGFLNDWISAFAAANGNTLTVNVVTQHPGS